MCIISRMKIVLNVSSYCDIQHHLLSDIVSKGIRTHTSSVTYRSVCECFYQLFTLTSRYRIVCECFYQLFTLTSMSRSVCVSVFIKCSPLRQGIGVSV